MVYILGIQYTSAIIRSYLLNSFEGVLDGLGIVHHSPTSGRPGLLQARCFESLPNAAK